MATTAAIKTAPRSELPAKKRIHSLDILRGLIIVVMAIDHVRDNWAITQFAPEDMAQTAPAWFFTRWITHFCAPLFVFLAGTSAFLYGNKIKDRKKLSRFLLSRGFWLILIEFIWMNLTFYLQLPWPGGVIILQVIWIIGICFVILAGLIHLPVRWITVVSLIIVLGHNLLDPVQAQELGSWSGVWVLMHQQGITPIFDTGLSFFVVYPLLPWIGVMGLGYVFGNVMKWESDKRKKFLLRAGLIIVGLFILLRMLNVYGDPSPWETQRSGFYTFMDFLNTTKYPPSLQFLCMTIGPGLLLLIPFEKWADAWSERLRIIGRVPFFFYVIHFPLIHVTSVLYFSLLYGKFTDLMGYHVNPVANPLPESYTPHVWVVYLMWVIYVVPLYYLCKWYNNYKFSHDQWYLKYL